MIRYTFTVLFIVVNTYCLFSQSYTLSGTVSDTSGNNLKGASIYIENTSKGTVSNSDGTFSIVLEKGEYTVFCSYVGYEDQIKNISLTRDQKIIFTLQEKTLLSDEIVISALQANSYTPVAQSNLTKEDIEAANISADIPYQLELTPSVVASSENGTGLGYTSMRIRGTDMSRINVTVNGVPLNDAESQGVFWVNMPDFTTSVDAIQIQRGVGTSQNGAAAFGASINFQTKKASPSPYADIATTVGSYGTFKRSISAGTGLMKNNFAFDVRYSKLDSDGWIERGFVDHESFYFSGAYIDDKNLLKATVLLGEEHTGITWWGVPDYMIDSIRNFNPAGQHWDDDGNEDFYNGQTDNYWQNHYQLHYSRKISKKWNTNFALHLTTGEGYYEQYIPAEDAFGTLNTFAEYNLPDVTIGDTTYSTSDMIRRKWLDNVFYGYTFATNYNSGRLSFSLGSSGNQYFGDHFGNVLWTKYNSGSDFKHQWYFNTGIKTDIMVFAKAQIQVLEGFFTYIDLQYRNINYSLDGPDDDLADLSGKYTWDFFNPKAGISYALDEHNTIFASYAVAGREPTRADIKNSTKDSTDSAPNAETLHDIELGYNSSYKRISFGINAFYMIYDNQLVNTGQLNSVGYAIMTNVKNSFRRGIEIVASTKPVEMFRWDLTASFSQNKIQNYTEYITHYDTLWNKDLVATDYGTTNISYSPSIVGSSNITFTPFKQFSISLINKYVGKQYIDNTSSENRMLNAYLVNNLHINIEFPLENLYMKKFSMQFAINNLFNSKYISNAYGGVWYEDGTEMSWLYYFPQAPTNIMCKAVLSF